MPILNIQSNLIQRFTDCKIESDVRDNISTIYLASTTYEGLYNIEQMNTTCKFCGALTFNIEASRCCKRGKVQL